MKRFLPTLLLASLVATLARGAMPAATHPRWTEVAPGVWKASIGKPEALTLLSAAGGKPQTAALGALPKVAFPLDEKEIEGRQWGWKTTARFPLGRNEDVYGLGVDFTNMRRNGAVFELHVDHWDSKKAITGRTHA